MVRHNRKGDVMVLVQYSSKNCSRADLDAALAKLKAFFLEQKDKVYTNSHKHTHPDTHILPRADGRGTYLNQP